MLAGVTHQSVSTSPELGRNAPKRLSRASQSLSGDQQPLKARSHGSDSPSSTASESSYSEKSSIFNEASSNGASAVRSRFTANPDSIPREESLQSQTPDLERRDSRSSAFSEDAASSKKNDLLEEIHASYGAPITNETISALEKELADHKDKLTKLDGYSNITDRLNAENDIELDIEDTENMINVANTQLAKTNSILHDLEPHPQNPDLSNTKESSGIETDPEQRLKNLRSDLQSWQEILLTEGLSAEEQDAVMAEIIKATVEVDKLTQVFNEKDAAIESQDNDAGSIFDDLGSHAPDQSSFNMQPSDNDVADLHKELVDLKITRGKLQGEYSNLQSDENLDDMSLMIKMTIESDLERVTEQIGYLEETLNETKATSPTVSRQSTDGRGVSFDDVKRHVDKSLKLPPSLTEDEKSEFLALAAEYTASLMEENTSRQKDIERIKELEADLEENNLDASFLKSEIERLLQPSESSLDKEANEKTLSENLTRLELLNNTIKIQEGLLQKALERQAVEYNSNN